MNKFELSSAFLVGHDAIDHEHEELVDILNNMVEDYISEDIPSCAKAWQVFCIKLEEHFTNEEKIMEDCGFIDDQHKSHHQEILDHIKIIGENCQTLADWHLCFFDMRHEILTQILKYDLYFAQYLVSIDYKNS